MRVNKTRFGLTRVAGVAGVSVGGRYTTTRWRRGLCTEAGARRKAERLCHRLLRRLKIGFRIMSIRQIWCRISTDFNVNLD